MVKRIYLEGDAFAASRFHPDAWGRQSIEIDGVTYYVRKENNGKNRWVCWTRNGVPLSRAIYGRTRVGVVRLAVAAVEKEKK